jgi:hypothetical protein
MNTRFDLNSLGKTLRRQYAATRPALVVQVANAGRLLTVLPEASETITPSGPPTKASTRAVPRGKAFELYVSIEGPSAAASGARIPPPVQAAATLALAEGRRGQMWTLPGPGDDRIVVRLQLGEDMTDEDARRLLQIIGETIAP